jgi:hypothetical protein
MSAGSSPGLATCTSWKLASTGFIKPATWPSLLLGHTRVVLEKSLAAVVYRTLKKLHGRVGGDIVDMSGGEKGA